MVHINNKASQDVIFKWTIKPNPEAVRQYKCSEQEREVKAGTRDIIQLKLVCDKPLPRNKIKTYLSLWAVTSVNRTSVLLNGFSVLSLAYVNSEINLSLQGKMVFTFFNSFFSFFFSFLFI